MFEKPASFLHDVPEFYRKFSFAAQIGSSNDPDLESDDYRVGGHQFRDSLIGEIVVEEGDGDIATEELADIVVDEAFLALEGEEYAFPEAKRHGFVSGDLGGGAVPLVELYDLTHLYWN